MLYENQCGVRTQCCAQAILLPKGGWWFPLSMMSVSFVMG